MSEADGIDVRPSTPADAPLLAAVETATPIIAGDERIFYDRLTRSTSEPTASARRRRTAAPLIAALKLLAAYIVALALFERLAPRRWVRAYQRAVNPFYETWTGLAFGWAVIEATGRRTGLARRTPVGGRLRRNVYWTVAGDGGHSDFVKNIEANPAVRVRIHGTWRTGRATLLPEDDARRRLLRLNPINSLFVMIAAKDPLTIRIDLDSPLPTDPCPGVWATRIEKAVITVRRRSDTRGVRCKDRGREESHPPSIQGGRDGDQPRSTRVAR